MELIIYIIKVQIAMALLYILYINVINKKVLPLISRLFLLLIVPISIIASYNWLTPQNSNLVNQLKSSINIPEIIITPTTTTQIGDLSYSALPITYNQIISIIYISGILLLILLLILKRIEFIKNFCSTHTFDYKDIKVDIYKGKMCAFSFANRIILGEKFYNEYKGSEYYKFILEHEYLHCKKNHSIDLFIIFIIKLIFWFNPIIWLIEKKIKEVHEYDVDYSLIKSGINAKQYAQLLINIEMGFPITYTGNYFSYLSIKNRIIMMNKNVTRGAYRVLSTLPLIALFIVCAPLFAFEANKKLPKEDLIVNANTPDTAKVIPFAIIDVKPSFQGGDQNNFTKYIFQHIKYPELAKNIRMEGRVILTFEINNDGNINNVKILRSNLNVNDKLIPKDSVGLIINPTATEVQQAKYELEEESIRVLNESPKWTPGEHKGEKVSTKFTFPIIYMLR